MATFPTLSTSSFDATAIPINADKLTKPTEGSSWNFYVLFLDSNNNMLQDAIKDTLEKGKGDVIINAKVCMSRIRVVYFGAESIKVEGTVINTKALAKALAKAKAKAKK